jgi:transcriptional regulator
MYLPNAFAEDRLEVRHGLMRAWPLATLIVAGDDGVSADLIPFMLYADEGDRRPRAAARPRGPRQSLVAQAGSFAPQCLIVFQGPEAYISPTWYETKRTTHKVVPTWNYAVVQARGVGARGGRRGCGCAASWTT